MAKEHPFSEWPNGFKSSPLLQEKIVYVGQLEVYEQGSELLDRLAGVSVSDSTIFRMATYYGQTIEQELYGPVCPQAVDQDEDLASEPFPGVVYAQMDGSMIFTDTEWQEVKVGRVFKASDCHVADNEERGGRIAKSQYAAFMGNYQQFAPRFESLIQPYVERGQELIFITDGALWMRNWMNARYPEALQILDFYHVCEHLGEFAKTVVSQIRKHPDRWYERQKAALLDGQPEELISRISNLQLSQAAAQDKKDKLLSYLIDNRYRMDYKAYRDRGLMIGSGAIEAAHRTLVQRRMKLSGQRWSDDGANHLLNLRACYMSQKEAIVLRHIIRKKAA